MATGRKCCVIVEGGGGIHFANCIQLGHGSEPSTPSAWKEKRYHIWATVGSRVMGPRGASAVRELLRGERIASNAPVRPIGTHQPCGRGLPTSCLTSRKARACFEAKGMGMKHKSPSVGWTASQGGKGVWGTGAVHRWVEDHLAEGNLLGFGAQLHPLFLHLGHECVLWQALHLYGRAQWVGWMHTLNGRGHRRAYPWGGVK